MYIKLVLEEADLKFLVNSVKFRDLKVIVNQNIILKKDKFMYCGMKFEELEIHKEVYSLNDFEKLRKKLEDM